MNRLIMRIGLLLATAFMLIACSSPAPAGRYKAAAYRPPVQPRKAPSQNVFHPQTIPQQNRYRPAPYAYKPATYSGPFLKPGELEPAVEFWRKVYAEWGRSEVAIHDDRYLDVVYEVMALPGYVDDSLTGEQKEMVRQRREFWKDQLAMVESKWRYGVPFDAREQQIVAKLQHSGRPLHSLLNGASERVHSQRGIRERFLSGLAISDRYDREFRSIFREAGLPEDLAYLPHVESSFQPAARSSAGAVGIWQFTQAAAKRFMPDGKWVDRRLDPFASTVGAARYLSYAYGLLGDWPAAITSYNHGIAGMKRAQNQVGRDFVRIVQNYTSPTFGFASRNYYAQFLAAREIAGQQDRYMAKRLNQLASQ
ncbi:MAG: lytic transglycosylase domain-containing protein [Gammaproteobacteria bacterium]